MSPISDNQSPLEPSGELSIEEAFSLAQNMQRNAQLAGAQMLYQRILSVAPDHVDAWHFLGVAKYQALDADGGIAAVRKALELHPTYGDAHANLANMLLQTGRTDEAETHLGRAIQLDSRAIPPRLTLATVRRLQGKFAEAEALAHVALAVDGGCALAHVSLGHTFSAQGDLERAVYHYNLALLLDPECRMSAEHQGIALYKLGRIEEARAHFAAWREAEPHNPVPRHLLAACGGDASPVRADDNYVRYTFDEFAQSFDARLADLGYRAPELIANSVARYCPSSPVHAILDAGCGTGLVGVRIRDFARRLVGVDLSTAMLARAAARGVYDELVEGELCRFLSEIEERFDVLTSADTLCYFGALDEFANAAYRVLLPGGRLLFTVEDAGEVQEPYLLQYHGRYAHRATYVGHCLARAGFRDIELAREVLRTEFGAPVWGLIFAARRTPR